MTQLETARLAELVEYSIGGDWGKDPDSQIEGYVPVRVIRGTDFTKWDSRRASEAAHRCIRPSSLEKRRLREGDLIIEVSGGGPTQPVGRAVIVDHRTLQESTLPLVCSNFFRQIRLKSTVEPRYIERFLKLEYLRGHLDKFQTQTTNLRNLRFSDFMQQMVVPLHGIDEQRRIAGRLDQIATHLDNVKARLETIPSTLKRFRASVLAAACSGRLTAGSREGRKFVELDGIGAVPSPWQATALGQLLESDKPICYGVIKLGAECADGVPCLRTSDVKPLSIDSRSVKRISRRIADQYRRTYLRGGEVLVNVRGTLGGVAVVPPSMSGWNVSREVAVVPIDGRRCSAEFAAFWIASPAAQVWLTDASKGVAYTGINLSDLRMLPVALPDLPEQAQIVRRVKQLFQRADLIEAQYHNARRFAEKLMPSVLANAFRGELTS